MTTDPVYPWVRLTQPLKTEPARDATGWVLPHSLWQEPEVLSLADRREDRVILVLGERGIGKSAVLRHEDESLRAAGIESRLVNLAVLSSDGARQQIRSAVSVTRGTVRHVLLDGIDDAPVAAEIDRFICEVLQNVDEETLASLRLRISCRTSRRSPLLEECLHELWGGPPLPVGVAGLAREDVVVAARMHGLDAEAFVGRLERERLVIPLASWPVTLVPLLKAAVNGQSLPRNVVEAYRLACLQLCTERKTPGLHDTRDRSFDGVELVALARKAAAAMQFCGRRPLTEERGEPGAVSFAELAQRSEPVDGGRTVQCTESAFRALAQAGVLVAVGHGRWSFAHRSFQEFLAAEYVQVHEVHRAVRDELLMVGDGSACQVVGVHRDVAAWLAVSDRELFEQMLRGDPRFLLLGELSMLPHEDRARVFDAVLALVRDGGDPQADWQMLRRLDSDLIAGRIAPLLRADVPLDEVHFALSVANACGRDGLDDALLDLAENAAVPDALRSLALNAVVGTLNDTQVDRLRRLIADPDPDVAAHALDLLWPDHLGTADLLANVPAPRPNYIGRAYMLLRRLPELLGEDDLLVAVRWARGALGTERTGGVRDSGLMAEAAIALLARAVNMAGTRADSGLINDLAEALFALVQGPYQDTVHVESEALREALVTHTTVRRSIARVVLERVQEELIAHFIGMGVFNDNLDSGYWALQWPILAAREQGLLRLLLIHPPQDAEEWSAVYDLGMRHAGLRMLTERWYTSTWPPEKWVYRAHHRRLDAERNQKAEREALRYDEASLQAAIGAVLAGADDVRTAWRWVLYHMHRTAEGDPVAVPEHLDLSGAPHFPKAGSPLHNSLLSAAAVVLRTAPLVDVTQLSPHAMGLWRDSPELYALAMLATDDQLPAQLAAARWTGLAIALLCTPDSLDERGRRDQLLEHCATASADRFEQALPLVIDRLGELGRSRVLDQLPQSLGQAHGQVLFDWATRRGRPIPDWAQALRVLAAHDNSQATAALCKALAAPPSRLHGDLESAPVRRWLAAADALTRLGGTGAWTKILNILEREPHLAPPLLKTFIASSSPGAWPLEPHQIHTDDLARLYTAMAEHVPMATDYVNTAGGFIGVEHELMRLHQALPVVISNRGDAQSLAALRTLAQRYPERRQLRTLATDLALRQTDQLWRPPATVEHLVQITTARLNRIVNDKFQLRDTVLESLQRLQDRLHGDNSWATALWNQRITDVPGLDGKATKTTVWWPTWEGELSDFVATFLRYDLADRGIVVNREVEITRPGLNGSRTDIQIQAAAPQGSAEPDPLTVIIETKGCWNPELPTGLAAQLVDKYLMRPGQRAGIYLIGYFDDPAWCRDSHGQPGRKHGPHTSGEILSTQQQIAERERKEKPVSVVPFVLDCRLPAAGSRQAHEGSAPKHS